MTEEQGNQIIGLLTEIRDGLHGQPSTPSQSEARRQAAEQQAEQIEQRLAAKREAEREAE